MGTNMKPKDLRRRAHFVGMGMLLHIAFMLLLFQLVIWGLAWAGVWTVDVPNGGLSGGQYDVLYAAVYAVAMGVPLWIAAGIFRWKENPFPAKRTTPGAVIVVALGGLALCMAANLATDAMASLFQAGGVSLPAPPVVSTTTAGNLWVNLLIFALLPAILEEMVFRGFVLGALRPFGDTFAIVVSAALFGLMHTQPLQGFFAFLMGLVLGYVFVRTGNLWLASLLHFTNNAYSTVMDLVLNKTPAAQQGQVYVLLFYGAGIVGFAVLLGAGVLRSPLVGKNPNKTEPALPLSKRLTAACSPLLIIAVVLFAALTVLRVFE